MSAARYKRIPAKGIYLSGATTIGLYTAHAGSVILYAERGNDAEIIHRRLARVMDLVTHDHDGREFRAPSRGSRTKSAPRLRVLAFDDMISHAFERWIALADVLECRKPADPAFVRWAMTGPLPSPEVCLAAAHYGSLSDSYFAEVMNIDGNLDASWAFRHVLGQDGPR